MNKVLFQPVRTTEEKIKNIPRQDGYVYFTSDSGKIYMDTDSKRINLGATGAAIYYGDASNLTADNNDYYNIDSYLVNGTPKTGDLILNSDGGFYKVERVENSVYICTLLSISGTGGGPVAGQTRPEITKLRLDSYSLINGSSAYFDLEAKSAFIGETPIDETLRI
jgi:hypothetical protein